MRERPEGWEFLLFAALLYEAQRELEPRWEALSAASLSGQAPTETDDSMAAAPRMWDGQAPNSPHEQKAALARTLEGAAAARRLGAAMDRLNVLLRRSGEIVGQLQQTMTAERSEQAFGKLGESGDADEITRFADDVMKPYRELLDWVDEFDAESPPPSAQALYQATREFGLQPLEQFRAYIADLLTNLDDLPAAIREGRPADGTFTLTLEIDDAALERINHEQERLLAKMQEQERGNAEVRHDADELSRWADELQHETDDRTRRAALPETPAGGTSTTFAAVSREPRGPLAKLRASRERREAERVQRHLEAESANWQAGRDAVAAQLEAAEHFAGDTNSDQILLQRGEALFAYVTNASLVEDRSTGGRWQGRSSGVSFPIGSIGGRSIRYRTGGTRGSYVQGTPVPTAIDVGTLFITNKRAVFQGNRQTRECRYDKLIGLQHSPDGSTVFSVSNRQKATVVSYGVNIQGWVAFQLDLALAHCRGTVATFIDQLREELAEIDRSRPTP